MKKKNCNRIYLLFLMGILMIFADSCKKDSNKSTGPVPIITTSAVGCNAGTKATCGGIITNDQGSTVSARGVCWSTGQTPTISDSKTIDGTGAGTFTSNVAGLSPYSTYYIRAYATNGNGTGYGSALSFTTTHPVAGEYYGGGLVVYDYDVYLLIAATSEQSSNATWGCYGTTIGGTNNYLGAGNVNTTYILNGCATSGTAADICSNLVFGGYSDWYLPCKTELECVYNYRDVLGCNNNSYWSSNEVDANQANAYSFLYNSWFQADKNAQCAVRAVRLE
ncbi:MAG: hypothetical protein WCJ58_08560 [bacterium]